MNTTIVSDVGAFWGLGNMRSLEQVADSARPVDGRLVGCGLGQHPARLQVLGGFKLEYHGRAVSVGTAAQRLIALVTVRNRPMSRTYVAHMLWPDVTEARAGANLRSVLWRLRRLPMPPVQGNDLDLGITAGVAVDLFAANDTAGILLDRSAPISPAELSLALRANFDSDLLPDWDEEGWLVQERERFRQLRLHCLEVLCDELSAAGWYGAAVNTGLRAVDADPLRESAHLALLKTLAAEGNRQEVRRRYLTFRRLLHDELGVEPSPELCGLVRCCLPDADDLQEPS